AFEKRLLCRAVVESFPICQVSVVAEGNGNLGNAPANPLWQLWPGKHLGVPRLRAKDFCKDSFPRRFGRDDRLKGHEIDNIVHASEHNPMASGTPLHISATLVTIEAEHALMIRKLKSGEYRLYSRKKDAKTGKRRNLGTFSSLEKAKQHERAVQYFKRY